MKKILIAALCIPALLWSCSKDDGSEAEASAENARKAFESWVLSQDSGNWTKTELGSYIMERQGATGAAVLPAGQAGYVLAEVTVRDLEGNVVSTTDSLVAKMLGTKWFRPYYDYEPTPVYRKESSLYDGPAELINSMTIGEKLTAAIPGKLLATSGNTASPAIYTIRITGQFDDLFAHEDSLICDYAGKEVIGACDTIADGLYYRRTRAGSQTDTLVSGDTAYMRYICRRTDGTAVDTNLPDSARVFFGDYAADSYNDAKIQWADKYSELTMDGQSMVSGMSRALFRMKPGEKGVIYMRSAYGYGSSGAGTRAIPPYCPLCFEVELFLNNQ